MGKRRPAGVRAGAQTGGGGKSSSTGYGSDESDATAGSTATKSVTQGSGAMSGSRSTLSRQSKLNLNPLSVVNSRTQPDPLKNKNKKIVGKSNTSEKTQSNSESKFSPSPSDSSEDEQTDSDDDSQSGESNSDSSSSSNSSGDASNYVSVKSTIPSKNSKSSKTKKSSIDSNKTSPSSNLQVFDVNKDCNVTAPATNIMLDDTMDVEITLNIAQKCKKEDEYEHDPNGSSKEPSSQTDTRKRPISNRMYKSNANLSTLSKHSKPLNDTEQEMMENYESKSFLKSIAEQVGIEVTPYDDGSSLRNRIISSFKDDETTKTLTEILKSKPFLWKLAFVVLLFLSLANIYLWLSSSSQGRGVTTQQNVEQTLDKIDHLMHQHVDEERPFELISFKRKRVLRYIRKVDDSDDDGFGETSEEGEENYEEIEENKNEIFE